jgi:hypothetical protein
MAITELYNRRQPLTVNLFYLLTEDGEQILTTNPIDPLLMPRQPLFTRGRTLTDRYGTGIYVV